MTELVADFLFYYTLVSLGLAFLLVALTVLLTFRDKHVMLALIFADLSIFAVVSTVGQSPLTNLVIPSPISRLRLKWAMAALQTTGWQGGQHFLVCWPALVSWRCAPGIGAARSMQHT